MLSLLTSQIAKLLNAFNFSERSQLATNFLFDCTWDLQVSRAVPLIARLETIIN